MHPLPRRNKQFLIYIILLMLVGGLMAGMRECRRWPAFIPSREHPRPDTLDVALIYGEPVYFLNNDSVAGLDFELLQLLAAERGYEIRLWPVVSLSRALDKLRSGHYDIVASLPPDSDMERRFPASVPIYAASRTIVALPGEKAPSSLLMLDGYELWHTPAATTAAHRLVRQARSAGTFLSAVETDCSDDMLPLRIPAGKKAVMLLAAPRQDESDASSALSVSMPNKWLFSPARGALRDSVDSWLRTFLATPAADSLMRRHNVLSL